MSDQVESFTFCQFCDDDAYTPREEREEDGFVSLFEARALGEEGVEARLEEEEIEEEALREPVKETIDIEAESRKIFEEAFTQGEKAGYEMGLQRVEPLVKRLNHNISELEAFKDELLERSRAMSVDLALLFAEAVVLRSCEDKKEIVGEMVRKALDICEGKSDITIRVRPGDTQYVSCDGNGFIKVVPDESIREPGFVIETNFGDIDGRMTTQIEELKKRILE